MKRIEPGRLYFWNFRSAVNWKVKAIRSDVHRPEFWYCEKCDDGAELCVHEQNLSEEPK